MKELLKQLKNNKANIAFDKRVFKNKKNAVDVGIKMIETNNFVKINYPEGTNLVFHVDKTKFKHNLKVFTEMRHNDFWFYYEISNQIKSNHKFWKKQNLTHENSYDMDFEKESNLVTDAMGYEIIKKIENQECSTTKT